MGKTTSEYDLTEGEDKITLLTMFQAESIGRCKNQYHSLVDIFGHASN